MKSFVKSLDTGGGHILVALFLILLGCGLLASGIDYGKEIAAGALGSLWTALTMKAKPTEQPKS